MDVSKEKDNVDKQPKSNLGGCTGAGWLPGESGNPKGRPKKGNAWADVIAEVMDQVAEDITGKPKDRQRTVRQAVVHRIASLAIGGDVRASQWLADREIGYPRQSVEINNQPKDTVKVIG